MCQILQQQFRDNLNNALSSLKLILKSSDFKKFDQSIKAFFTQYGYMTLTHIDQKSVSNLYNYLQLNNVTNFTIALDIWHTNVLKYFKVNLLQKIEAADYRMIQKQIWGPFTKSILYAFNEAHYNNTKTMPPEDIIQQYNPVPLPAPINDATSFCNAIHDINDQNLASIDIFARLIDISYLPPPVALELLSSAHLANTSIQIITRDSADTHRMLMIKKDFTEHEKGFFAFFIPGSKSPAHIWHDVCNLSSKEGTNGLGIHHGAFSLARKFCEDTNNSKGLNYHIAQFIIDNRPYIEEPETFIYGSGHSLGGSVTETIILCWHLAKHCKTTNLATYITEGLQSFDLDSAIHSFDLDRSIDQCTKQKIEMNSSKIASCTFGTIKMLKATHQIPQIVLDSCKLKATTFFLQGDQCAGFPQGYLSFASRYEFSYSDEGHMSIRKVEDNAPIYGTIGFLTKNMLYCIKIAYNATSIRDSHSLYSIYTYTTIQLKQIYQTEGANDNNATASKTYNTIPALNPDLDHIYDSAIYGSNTSTPLHDPLPSVASSAVSTDDPEAYAEITILPLPPTHNCFDTSSRTLNTRDIASHNNEAYDPSSLNHGPALSDSDTNTTELPIELPSWLF